MQQKRKRYQKDTTTTSDDITTLISLVRENAALYNYKMQPSFRKRQDVLNGWQHIAEQLGGKYTVEECRRKWKNLRDTYHQYRLRKPKMGDGLAKWRYAKDLDFLSTIYQPKLRSQRQQQCNDVTSQILQVAAASSDSVKQNIDEVIGDHHRHHSGITLVNDGDEAFILATYEESVNDDIATIDHSHDCNSELGLNYRHHHRHEQKTQHYDDDDNVVNSIIKNERNTTLDGEDGAGTEVDYEEVCLYEEAANDPNDCETIIPCNTVSSGKLNSHPSSNSSQTVTINSAMSSSNDKDYHYTDFCIDSMQPHTSTSSGGVSAVKTSMLSGSNAKIKGIISTMDAQAAAMIAASSASDAMDCGVNAATLGSSGDSVPTSIIQIPMPGSGGSNAVLCHNNSFNGVMQIRHELDLYFDFLKQKMQRFSKEEITAIQIDMLNCVLRRESNASSSNLNTSATGNVTYYELKNKE